MNDYSRVARKRISESLAPLPGDSVAMAGRSSWTFWIEPAALKQSPISQPDPNRIEAPGRQGLWHPQFRARMTTLVLARREPQAPEWFEPKGVCFAACANNSTYARSPPASLQHSSFFATAQPVPNYARGIATARPLITHPPISLALGPSAASEAVAHPQANPRLLHICLRNHDFVTEIGLDNAN